MSNVAYQIANVSVVDRLGAIKAQIAELKAVEDFLAAEIKAMGVGAYDGEAFRANVVEVASRESADPKAMEAKLRDMGVDGRWFSRNMKSTSGYTAVKVVARKS